MIGRIQKAVKPYCITAYHIRMGGRVVEGNSLEISRRCIARPTDHQATLLDRLGLSLPRLLKVAGQM